MSSVDSRVKKLEDRLRVHDRYIMVTLREWREHAKVCEGLSNGCEAQDYQYALNHMPDDFDGFSWFFPLGVPDRFREMACLFWDDYTEYLEESDNANYRWYNSEERQYQLVRRDWTKHESSWYFRKLNRYDNQGCNQVTGCIPECPYFPEKGRLSKEGKISYDDIRFNASDFKGKILEDHF